MPKGQNLISHVKITNTSSGKVVTLDGAEADSIINQIDNLTVENRNKAYIRYQDPATKSQVVLELCCVEIERLPNTEEEFDARECELDCCEQQFFSTFKTSINQQTGEFPKKSQPSVPDKPSTPDKPKEDTPTKPSENSGTDNGSTNTDTSNPTKPSENSGSVTPSQPSENGGSANTGSSTQPSENNGNNGNTGTDNGSTQPSGNGNTGTTEPTTPSENNGNSDSGTSTKPSENNGSTDSPSNPSGNTDSGSVTPSQPSDNTNTGNSGNTDSGTSTQPSENNGTTPSNPSENGGGTDNGNSGNTDSGNTTPTQPSENGNTGNTETGTTQPTEEPTVTNNIVVKGKGPLSISDENMVLLTIPVKGKVGETVRVGDFITPEILAKNKVELNDDGNVIRRNHEDYNIEISPNLKDYMYTIKEDGTEFVIQAIGEELFH